MERAFNIENCKHLSQKTPRNRGTPGPNPPWTPMALLCIKKRDSQPLIVTPNTKRTADYRVSSHQEIH